MKVKELIEQLQELDPETQIVMSCDNIGGEKIRCLKNYLKILCRG